MAWRPPGVSYGRSSATPRRRHHGSNPDRHPRRRQAPYILGHDDNELDRLIRQARFFGDLTEEVLRRAGVGPGMTVLDLGCGAGDVAFLAARLVGPTGTVIGVDRSAEAVAVAERRAGDAGLANVSFVVQQLSQLTLTAPVDALVGRLVLMYLDDPAAVLRRLLEGVRPGGVVAFQEMDMGTVVCQPECALFAASADRIIQGHRRRGRGRHPGGAAAEEVVAADATIVPPPLIGAWARKPAR